ncbi:hypothetical protein SD427_17005 [Chryseobacterium sp. JJR-5R]|uniref:hypothetical protein n=1 Tax=Chryseobacterium sp. JJR-5R TaxID=3093923 RepID=UPI002A74BC7A|nr:hypothetical protein [Chryseobacterium sp. JJR-5R]WPO82442.1 hypothetical protein SD427_17005 [Chryseobacterium sp. JJR-5R]
MLSISIRAQNSLEIIKGYEEKAINYENEERLIEALNYYSVISRQDTLDIGKRAIKKIELLLPKCRELFYNEIKGNWKLKKKFDLDYYSNIKYTDFIKVENNRIFFINSKKIVSEIDLESNPFSYNAIAGFPSIKLEKEIWYFSIRVVNGQKRLRLRKKTDKNGNLIATLDHRGVIINERKTKKALKKEINTYYIKR